MTIYEEIQNERDYQINRWGNEIDDLVNNPWMWTAYITQYAGKWLSGAFLPFSKEGTDLFRTSMIKVAAIAIAAVESLDRQRNENGSTFYEA